MKPSEAVLRALALGAITGLRSSAGIFFLGRALRQARPAARRSRPAQILADDRVHRIAGLALAGEMVADKLPFIPARTDPLPFAGRVIIGAGLGWVVARAGRTSGILPALAGAAAAAVVANTATTLRRSLATGDGALPDPVIALAEDAAVLSTGLSLSPPFPVLR